MKHLIIYDLHIPGQYYPSLIDAIKSLGTARKLGRSCWAVKTNLTSTQIRNYLATFLDSNDYLFVCPFGSFATLNCAQETVFWLNN